MFGCVPPIPANVGQRGIEPACLKCLENLETTIKSELSGFLYSRMRVRYQLMVYNISDTANGTHKIGDAANKGV